MSLLSEEKLELKSEPKIFTTNDKINDFINNKLDVDKNLQIKTKEFLQTEVKRIRQLAANFDSFREENLELQECYKIKSITPTEIYNSLDSYLSTFSTNNIDVSKNDISPLDFFNTSFSQFFINNHIVNISSVEERNKVSTLLDSLAFCYFLPEESLLPFQDLTPEFSNILNIFDKNPSVDLKTEYIFNQNTQNFISVSQEELKNNIQNHTLANQFLLSKNPDNTFSLKVFNSFIEGCPQMEITLNPDGTRNDDAAKITFLDITNSPLNTDSIRQRIENYFKNRIFTQFKNFSLPNSSSRKIEEEFNKLEADSNIESINTETNADISLFNDIKQIQIPKVQPQEKKDKKDITTLLAIEDLRESVSSFNKLVSLSDRPKYKITNDILDKAIKNSDSSLIQEPDKYYKQLYGNIFAFYKESLNDAKKIKEKPEILTSALDRAEKFLYGELSKHCLNITTKYDFKSKNIEDIKYEFSSFIKKLNASSKVTPSKMIKLTPTTLKNTEKALISLYSPLNFLSERFVSNCLVPYGKTSSKIDSLRLCNLNLPGGPFVEITESGELNYGFSYLVTDLEFSQELKDELSNRLLKEFENHWKVNIDKI